MTFRIHSEYKKKAEEERKRYRLLMNLDRFALSGVSFVSSFDFSLI